MTKTTLDICTHALRLLGVLGVGESADADSFALAKEAFEAEFDRVKADQGFTWTFDANSIPNAAFLPFSMLCAATISPVFSVAGPSASRAIGALRSLYFPDDREDSRDLDDDGTVSDAEIEAGKRAAYY